MKFWKYAALGAAVVSAGAAAAYAYYRTSVDEPEFTVLMDEGEFQLRRYPSIIVAEVTHTGDRRQALQAGFKRLAAYIFAEDRGGEKIAMTSPVMQDGAEKIAMTAPVMQDASDKSGTWRTRFVMPASYTMEMLPPPPADITLTQLDQRKIAAVRFSGNGSSEDLTRHEAALRAWIAAKGLVPAGEAEYAFYDAPMVPPPLRRNEVMIPVG